MMIKVCGMRDSDNIKQVDKLGVDLMGFIFYKKSPRYVHSFPDFMPKNAKRVGVFVNEELETIINTSETYTLDYLQLHGSESTDYCSKLNQLGYKIIKAFSVSTIQDIAKAEKYETICEMFIFDTKCDSVGGSGQTFNWDLLKHYNGETPFLLSGGLGPKNIEFIKDFKHPKLIGYDLNSAFETAPALKDINLLNEFLKNLKYDEQNK